MLRTGMSVLTDKRTGEEVLQWDKYRADADKAKAEMEATLQAFMQPLQGLAKPVKAPKIVETDLLTEYVLADLHVGMYAYAPEAGEDYDSTIAYELATQAMDRMIASAPPSEKCVINQLGDFYHMDSSRNETTAGTPVDVDTRYDKVIDVGISIVRYAIDNALRKHKHVTIRNTPGNHDRHSCKVLDAAMKAYFEREPRVTVANSQKAFWAYKHGACLVGLAHGDDPKPKAMPGLLAVDYPQWWAECEFKYVRHGHLHHEVSFTDLGVKCEGLGTIAPKDAWHAKKGYRSPRDTQAITLHARDGQQERHYFSIKRIQNESQRDA